MKDGEIEFCDQTFFSMESKGSAHSNRRSSQYSIRLTDDFRGQDMRLEHPREGISLLISRIHFPHDVVIPYRVGGGSVAMSCILSGHAEQWENNRHTDRLLKVNRPCDMVLHSRQYEGVTFIKGGIPLLSVSIYLERTVLQSMIEGEEQFSSLSEVMDGGNGIHLLGKYDSSPQTQMIANQMLNCPYGGACRKLFLESKTLEFIAATLNRMTSAKNAATIPLSRDDIERLHEARRLLFKHMEEPPTIRELARLVGLNEFKLKKGFREIFGCTPFQALRAHRMEQAHAMLQDTDMTVGMVAAMVGYTNMSHFISAFRNQFGITPGSLLSHGRRHCLT